MMKKKLVYNMVLQYHKRQTNS